MSKFFIICWGTSSLARIHDNFHLFALSQAFLKSTDTIWVLILNSVCFSTRIFDVK